MAYGGLLDILQGILGQGQGYGQDQGSGLLGMMAQRQQQQVPTDLATDEVRGQGLLGGGYGTDRLLGADINPVAAPAAAGAGAATANAVPLAPAAGGQGGGLLSGLFGGGAAGGAGSGLLGGLGGWAQKNPAAIDALVTGFANIGNKNVGNPFLYGASQAAPEFEKQRARDDLESRQEAMKSAMIKLGYPAELAAAAGKIPDLGTGIITQALKPRDAKSPIAVGNSVFDPNTNKFIQGPNAGGYEGTSMDAQNWNIIQTADPSSQRYANAYNQLFEQPKLQPVQTATGMQLIPTMPTVPAGVKKPTGYASPATTGGGTDAGGGGAGTSAAPADGTASPGTGPRTAAGIGAPITIPGTEPKPLEDQNKQAQFYATAAPELKIVEKNFAALSDWKNQIGGMLPAQVSSFTTSHQYQQARNALKTIIATSIYSKSGASAAEVEVQRQADQLMPVIGESKESIADKMQRIRILVDAIKIRAGSAVKPETTFTQEQIDAEKRRRGLR